MFGLGKGIAIAIIIVVVISAGVFLIRPWEGPAPSEGPAPNVKIYFKDQTRERGEDREIERRRMMVESELLRLGAERSLLLSPGEVLRIPVFIRVIDFLRDKTSISLEFRIAPTQTFALVEVTGGDFGTPSCESYFRWELEGGVRISVSLPPDLVEKHGGKEKLIAEVAVKIVEDKAQLFFPGIQEVVLIDRNGNPTISERDLKLLYLEPTVKEIQLQREGGGWVTIWTGEKPMFLKPGEPAQFLDEVHVPEGTYVASRVAYSKLMMALDANGDGDGDDVLDIVRSLTVIEDFHETNQYWLPGAIEGKEKEERIWHLTHWGFSSDYADDFVEGYFRAVWPGPWRFDGKEGEIVFDLRHGWELTKLLGLHPHRVRESLSKNFIPDIPVNTVAVAYPSPWEKVPTTLQVSPATFPTLHRGQSIGFTAILTDPNGNPLLGRDITWSASAGSILPTSGWTSVGMPWEPVSEENPFGCASHACFQMPWYNFVYLETEGETPVTITASFAGDDWYEASSWSCTAACPVYPTVGITFDGLSEDWKQRYEPLAVDEVGDAPNADEDLKSIYVIDDGNYLYFMVEFLGKPSPAGVFWDLDTNLDGDIEYHICCSSDGVFLDKRLPDHRERIADLGYAFKEIIEFKVPFEMIDSPSVIKLQVFSRDAEYNAVDWMFWFTYPKEVKLIPSAVAISPLTFSLESGNSTTLTATLTDGDGNPLEGKTIAWWASDGIVEPARGVTDGSGRVSITYTAPAVGEETSVTIAATFAGGDGYGASRGSATGTITPPPGVRLIGTILTVEPSTFTVESEDSVTLTVTLTDVNGNPLEGKMIYFSVTTMPNSGVTDSSGKTSIRYTAPSVDTETSVTVEATFQGDATYRPSSGSSTGTVTPPPPAPPPKVSTSITISPSTFTVGSESSITFTATLTDADGNPLEGKTVNWGASGGFVEPAGITDASGHVSVTYTAPTVETETSVVIIASFAGDDRYEASSGSSAGTITPPS